MFLRGLVDIKISGLVVGFDFQTLVFSAVVVGVVEERRLFVLFAPYSVGFAVIGRAVVDANAYGDVCWIALTEWVYNAVCRVVV